MLKKLSDLAILLWRRADLGGDGEESIERLVRDLADLWAGGPGVGTSTLRTDSRRPRGEGASPTVWVQGRRGGAIGEEGGGQGLGKRTAFLVLYIIPERGIGSHLV